MNEVLTQTEAARRVGVSAVSIMWWIKTGRLPARKAGKIVLIDLEDLERANEWSLQNDMRHRKYKRRA